MANVKNVGISRDANEKMKDLVARNFFTENQDVYRLAVSIAIFKRVDIEGYQLKNPINQYSTVNLDPDGKLKLAIGKSYPEFLGEEYKASQYLADQGVSIIYDHIESEDEVNLKSLLEPDAT